MIAVAVSFAACDKDSPDNPDNPNGGTDNPGASVSDPAGTVTLKMRNADNGKTYLDDILIDTGNNFTGARFVDVGPVAGLGNITSIPKVGWTSRVAVNPGHGYVAYSNGSFYRLYVTSWTVTTGDLIIGAEVKYQKPFAGKDENLNLDAQSLTFDKDGGNQGIIISNASIIPFSITSSAEWCTVYTASTTDFNFLVDAIKIYVQPNNDINTSEATVTLTTAHGKAVQIKILRLGATPVIEFQNSDVTIQAESGTQNIPILTNINLKDIAVSSSCEWLTVSTTDDTERIRQNSSAIKYVNGLPNSRNSESESGAHYYNIKATYETNYGGSQRYATITASNGNHSASIDVTQMGSDFQFSSTEEVVSSSSGSYVIYAASGIPDENLTVSADTDWCRVSFIREDSQSRASHSHSIEIVYDVNKDADERIAHINVKTPDNKTLATYTLTQLGASIDVATDQQPVTIGSKGTEGMSFAIDSPFDSEELVVSSSAEWLKGEIGADNNLIVNTDYNPTVEEREATLTVSAKDSDVSTNINFKQEKGYIKLKVSDTQTLSLDPSATLYRQKRAITETYTIETSFPELKPNSSADWCVISSTSDNMVVRISESPDINRDCTISFEGTPCYLVIKQIKCNLGDDLIGSSEAYSGRLIYINDTTGEAVMSRMLGNQLVWSKEAVVTGATDLYDGIKNTAAIKNIPNWRELYPAFAAVDDLNENTDAGWHIPAFWEGTNEKWLSSLHNSNYHWSSTENGANYVHTCFYGTFTTSAAWTFPKTMTEYNRHPVYTMAVRRFKIE